MKFSIKDFFSKCDQIRSKIILSKSYSLLLMIKKQQKKLFIARGVIRLVHAENLWKTDISYPLIRTRMSAYTHQK